MFRRMRSLYLAIIAIGCLSVFAQAQATNGINCDASKPHRTDSKDPLELYCAASALKSKQKSKEAGKMYLRAFRSAQKKVIDQIQNRLDSRIKEKRPTFMSFLEDLRPTVDIAVAATRRLEVSDSDRYDASEKANSLLRLMAYPAPIFAYDEVDSALKITRMPARVTQKRREATVQGKGYATSDLWG